MAVTDSALIGIIVAGSVAGVILLVVFAIITVYCYRSLDHSSDKKLLRKKKRALLYAETMSGPMYYPETTSSGGTTARLVPPHIPVLYGRYSAATTMEREKHKSKKSHSSHQNSPRTKYGEREEHMEFQDEHQGSNTGSIREDNYASVARESYDSDVPVIVTYLGDPIKRDEETDVKVALDDDTTSPVTTALPDSDEAQTRADPDNDGQTSGEESETDESSEAYRRRQREPPKGDVNPPADYLMSGKDSTVLY